MQREKWGLTLGPSQFHGPPNLQGGFSTHRIPFWRAWAAKVHRTDQGLRFRILPGSYQFIGNRWPARRPYRRPFLISSEAWSKFAPLFTGDRVGHLITDHRSLSFNSHQDPLE